jgi:ABC-type nitrate/sulfonate/bicarbonate transport system substrate-binding protein
MVRCFGLLVLVLALPARASTPMRVILPESGNLQHMAFWVARGAGLFEREGLDVTLSIPSSPGGVYQLVLRDDAQAAVLPPPVYIDLIAQRAPIRLVANLLSNDPANLVIRRSALTTSPQAPISERLRGLRGLRIGVAPGPVGRLRALFASQGLIADDVAQLVSLGGPVQNEAFVQNKVDALFAHTPYLEKALLEQDGVLLVNLSSGEVPALASRQIHALCVRTEWAQSHQREVSALVRALTAAAQLIHRNQPAAVAAILREMPERKRPMVERIVALYEPAIPTTPQVSAQGIRGALALFPSSRTAPDLAGIDLDAYIDNRFVHRNGRLPWIVGASTFALFAGLISVRRWRRSRPPKRVASG